MQMSIAMAHELERFIADDSEPVEMLAEPLHLPYPTRCKSQRSPSDRSLANSKMFSTGKAAIELSLALSPAPMYDDTAVVQQIRMSRRQRTTCSVEENYR